MVTMPPVKARSPRAETLRLLLRSKSFVSGVFIVGFWVFCAIFGATIAPYDPLEQSADILQSPNANHFFGTDNLGRDVFSRVLAGARDILTVAPLAMMVGIVGGTIIGLVTAYYRGLVDDVIGRIIDTALAIPVVIIALTALVALGGATPTIILVIGVVFTPIVARTVRAAAMSEREFDYVQAAELRKERGPYVMFGEILPNISGPVLVEATVRLGYAIFTVAGLTFLGFGVQPPSPDWALQISDNFGLLSDTANYGYYWTVLFPAVAVASLVVGVYLIADGVQQALRPEGVEAASTAGRGRRRRKRERRIDPAATTPGPALEIRNLDVAYRVRGRALTVISDLSLSIRQNESYGLVGESGCGKSTVALAAVGYLPRNGHVQSGSIKIGGQDVLELSPRELRKLRADAVSIVYQNPGTALNPSIRIGQQVAEVFRVRGSNKADALDRAREALAKVQIAAPDSVMSRYPHQLSGGMQQRVLIAMALAKDPALLILDEPTTGLDATVEAEVLDLITELQSQFHTSALYISHNLGVIAKMCERVGVLYAGRLVEEGPVEMVLHDPRHPYTVGLVRSIPRRGVRKDHGRLDTIPGFLPTLGAQQPGCVFADRCGLADAICHEEEPPLHELAGGRVSRCHFHDRAHELPRTMAAEFEGLAPVDRSATPLLRASDLTKLFRQEGRDVHALEGASLELWPGETLGLVGESGSGKTTLARALLGIVSPTRGEVVLGERTLPPRLAQRSATQVRALQIVFQNPDSALNPRHTVRQILRRSLKKLAGLRQQAAETRLHELVDSVRLAERYLPSRPEQLSGGLKQRVGIARAFAGEPRIVICDEPTSALDVSVQAAILNLLVELQAERRVSYLFISHDLGVVRYLADRIAVLYLGRLMEVGPAEVVFAGPHHPYTAALLSAVPTIDGGGGERIKLGGDIPSSTDPPSGCVFHTRCHRKIGAICEAEEPPLAEVEAGHLMRCHIPIEQLGTSASESIQRARRDDEATIGDRL
jgi:peptide/nickel transport system ATP-binding protein